MGASEIAAKAVVADEIDGVAKLLFEQCFGSSETVAVPGAMVAINCLVTGASPGEMAVATRSNAAGHCFDVSNAQVTGANTVQVRLSNNCVSSAALGNDARVSIIVFNIF